MAIKNIDKRSALMEIVMALRDNNNKVLVENVDAQSSDGLNWVSEVGKDEVFIPAPNYNGKYGNRVHAKSVKIGKNILITRDEKGGYLVKTQKGDVRFDNYKDSDFRYVLSATLNKYELGENSDYMYPVVTYMDKEFKEIATKPVTSKKSKYQEAAKQLAELGVEPNRLKKYVKEKHPELTEEQMMEIFAQQKQNG